MNRHSFSHAGRLTLNSLLFQDCFSLLSITTIKLWRSPCTRLRNLPDIHRLRWGCLIIHRTRKLWWIFPTQRPGNLSLVAKFTLIEAKIENCTIFASNVTAWIKCLGSCISRCGIFEWYFSHFVGFENLFFHTTALRAWKGFSAGPNLASPRRPYTPFHPYEWPTHAFC